MENRFIKIACLTGLIMGNSLQAMDIEPRLKKSKEQLRLNERLIAAALEGKKEMIIDLLGQGADVNAAYEYGTPLIDTVHFAENKEAICKLLLSHGADVNAKDHWDRPALLYVGLGDDEVLMSKLYELLLSYRADVNAQGKDGWTALLMACNSGQPAVVKFLLDKGADIYAQNKEDKTCLMLAAGKGHKDVCKLLVNAIVKPTKEQVQRVVALLGIAKKRQIGALNSVPRDVVKLIGREQYNDLKRENKPNAEVEINRIPDEKMKQELLDYLNKI